jgi:hypothetical protein
LIKFGESALTIKQAILQTINMHLIGLASGALVFFIIYSTYFVYKKVQCFRKNKKHQNRLDRLATLLDLEERIDCEINDELVQLSKDQKKK